MLHRSQRHILPHPLLLVFPWPLFVTTMAKLTIGQVADAMAIKLNKRAGRRRPPTPAATRLLFHFLRMIETLAED